MRARPPPRSTSLILSLYFSPADPTPLAPPLLASLEAAYSALGGAGVPTADVVPVVTATAQAPADLAARLVGRGDVPGCVVWSPPDAAAATALADALAAAGAPRPALLPSLCGEDGRVMAAPSPQPSSSSSIPPTAALPVARAAVGGTFDRLHAGHRLLLAVSALAASQSLFIGVTDGALVAKKAGRAHLQPYASRAAAAASFAAAVGLPGLIIETSPLTDPEEPTAAETDPGVGALVVSAETVVGGQAILAGRARRGLPPLALVVVGLVGAGGGKGKVSSTDLRDAE